MSTTRYADAVAAVRAMENFLLRRSDLEQLINTESESERSNIIASRRGTGAEELSLESVWELIRGYAPDCDELRILLYRNDFHNLKAALKSMIAGREPHGCYVRPTGLDLDTLCPVLAAKEYEKLPQYIRSTAEETYELLTRTLDGQLADSLADTACMRAMQRDADRYGSSFMKRFAQLTTVCADIKTAYRCSIMKKPLSFIETAVCGSSELDRDQLVRASLGGTSVLLGFLESAGYGQAAGLLAESPAKFEKWCDDAIMELACTARMQPFGAEPLAAYYIAAETELKNLRIISVCKEAGIDRDTITERMRTLYV